MTVEELKAAMVMFLAGYLACMRQMAYSYGIRKASEMWPCTLPGSVVCWSMDDLTVYIGRDERGERVLYVYEDDAPDGQVVVDEALIAEIEGTLK